MPAARSRNLAAKNLWNPVVTSNQLCPECGKPRPTGSPDGLCPNCLLTLGLPTTLSENPTLISLSASAPGDWIGRYKLLEQIGEGGFGIVWMAEQQEPV